LNPPDMGDLSLAKSKRSANRKTKKKTPHLQSFWQSVYKSRWFQESLGIFLLAITVYLSLSLASELRIAAKLPNICGNIGQIIARFLWKYCGICSAIVPLVTCIWGIMAFRHRKIERWGSRLLGIAILLPSFTTLFASNQSITFGNEAQYTLSGLLGRGIHSGLSQYIGLWGTQILTFAIVLIALLISTDISYYMMSKRAKNKLIDWIYTWFDRLKHRLFTFQERRRLKKEQKAEKQAMALEDQKARRLEEVSLPETPPVIADGQNSGTDVWEEPEAAIKIAQQAELFTDEKSMEIIRTVSAEYESPPLSLLEDFSCDSKRDSEETLFRKSELLVQKLNDFNIQGHVTEVCPGPVITRYEFEPAPGIKISKITGLANDLALGLKSRFGLRVAPVPGKSALGIEIPNQHRDIVNLKELLISEQFRTSVQQSILSIPLGKTTAGQPFIADLKRMPHLLIAGATGSGKSVCINSILCGLMYSTTPQQLRLILIDPKMLELSDFNGIPHLREPVITDVKKTPDALNWALDEMNKRYVKLATLGVRNIDQFNVKVTKPDYEGDEKPLPYMIIVIDELADLMLTAPSVVEEAIQRLAQMARASGIHLIIATQRPSVDVITGVIKANLPCRMAFQVTSRVDSRTILDSIGAEKLLGMGDCLFIPPGTSQIVRLHGAYVPEYDIKKVVDFLQKQPIETSEDSIFKAIEGDHLQGGENDDPLYDQAVRLVLTSGLASISMLQRRLKVGHSRASRLIDFMELNGIVGPFEGSKPREILVERDEFLERMNQIEEEEQNEVF
jgi:DNA segregation ATPase FtsK/SpoIIIE, S-DNA-T family